MHACMHAFIHTYIHTYIHTCMHADVCRKDKLSLASYLGFNQQ